MAEDEKTAAVPPWPEWAKIFWMLVGGAVCLLWGMSIVKRLTPPYPHLHDFVQEWTSAKNYFAGEPIYLDMNKSFPIHLGDAWQVGHIDVNAHPPASVLVLLPFGLLDYTPAYLTWNILSLVFLLISLVLIVRRKGLGFSPWMLLPITTILISGNSLNQQINQGQLNLLLLLLFTGAWTADRSKHPAIAGFLLGLAAAIKLFPAYMFLYFLMRRDWRAIAAGGVAFVALTGATYAVFGQETFVDYVQNVMPRVGGFRDWWANASAAGFWSRLLDGQSGHSIPVAFSPLGAKIGTLLSWGVLTIVAGWTVLRAKSQPEVERAFSVTIIAMLLVSPITWDHYFLLLLLPFLIFWKYMSPNLLLRCVLFGLIIVLTFVNPKWIWDATIPGAGELSQGTGATSVAQPIQVITVLSYQFYGLLALFLLSLSLRMKTPCRETADGA